jgi:excisionase family DNA binding protein
MPTTTSKRDRLLVTREVADRLQVGTWTVLRLARDGHLPFIRYSPRAPLRYCETDVERLLRGPDGGSES